MNDLFLEPSVRACLLAAAVGTILLAARVRSGRVRHAAWTAVLGAMLLMPLLPRLVPAVPVPLPEPIAFEMPVETPLPDEDQESQVQVGQALPPVQSQPQIPWAILIYLSVLALLLARVAYGWVAMRRIERTGSRVPELSAWESNLVATPLTTGILRPRVILPPSWRTWPENKLRAVLAHEREHARRRDPLVALIARANRCIFWFHPLAWWLERQLAAEAEFACDDAALEAAGEPRRYAEILVEMADTVRRAGGRLAWHGVGVDGTGVVGRRIDRVLGGTGGTISRARRAAVAAACGAAIFLAAACRQPTPPAAANFKPQDQDMRDSMARNGQRKQFHEAALAMTPEQVAAAEKALQTNPEDIALRQKLLLYYWKTGPAAARRPHILWLIEHHPESEAAGMMEAHIYRTAADPHPDPAGYDLAAKAWLAKTAAPDTPAAVLGNAAGFFTVSDKPQAEKLLLRAKEVEPNGGWSSRLGRLYYDVLVGSNASQPMGVVRSVDRAARQGAYANEVRKKLDETKDAKVLVSVARSLILQQRDVGFDAKAVGKSYLERAAQIDPAAARSTLLMVRGIEQSEQIRAALGDAKTPQEQYTAIAKLPDSKRAYHLARLASREYIRGDMASYYKKGDARDGWRTGGRYAREALDLAAKAANTPDYGTIVYECNMVLGMAAMREGKSKDAERYLIAASKAPKTDELANPVTDPLYFMFRLPRDLLKAGRRDAVIEYLERFGQTNESQRDRLLESASMIRQGRTPFWVEQQ